MNFSEQYKGSQEDLNFTSNWLMGSDFISELRILISINHELIML